MSFNNYKELVWDETIMRELERACVFAADCNTSYQGKIEKKGDTVRILGVGKPTIKEFTNDEKIKLGEAEEVGDSSVSLTADRVPTFNYEVGDIDKAQGAGNILPVLNQEASEAFANKVDTFIANLSLTDKQSVRTAAKNIDAMNCLDVLDEALEVLYSNDVTRNTEMTATVPPWFFTLFRRAYTKIDTDNSGILKNGEVARYNGLIIRMSNNCAVDKNGNSLIQVKTKRAIGLAKSNIHSEPYRPEGGFADCVKGFMIYGAKIVRPKEMVSITAKKAN